MIINLVKNFCSDLKKLGHQSFIYGDIARDIYFKIPMIGKCHIVTEAPDDISKKILADDKYKPIKDILYISNFRSRYSLHFPSEKMIATYDKNESLEEKMFKHLQTLDFTIDMMLISDSGSIAYSSKAQSDIKNRIVRYNKSPKDGVFNNPLSIIRACAIASIINGTIENKTLMAMKEYLPLLRFLYKSDVKLEIAHTMLRTKEFSKFIEFTNSIGVRSYIFPYLHLTEFSKELGDIISLNRPFIKMVSYYYETLQTTSKNNTWENYFDKPYVVAKLVNVIKKLKNDEEFVVADISSICFALKHPSNFSKGELVTLIWAVCKILNKPFPKHLVKKIFRALKTEKVYQSYAGI